MSNDSIRQTDTSSTKFRRLRRKVQYPSMPAVKIGRLAIAMECQRQGLGTEILDSIKTWFTDGNNKTGCRFIIVDAVNSSNTLKFYERNGFEFLDNHSTSITDDTRLMFFDLFTFRE